MGGREILVLDSPLYCGEGNFLLFASIFFLDFIGVREKDPGKRIIGLNTSERRQFTNLFMPMASHRAPVRPHFGTLLK